MKPARPFRLSGCLVLCLLLFSSLSAQIRLAAYGGVHAANLPETNSVPGYDTAMGKYFTSRTAFQLGVLAEIPFGKNNLYFQPGLLYSAKGNQFEKSTDSAIYHSDTAYLQRTLNLNYVEMPLFITWKLALSKDRKNQVYFSAGPYLAFIYSVSASYQQSIIPYHGSEYAYTSRNGRFTRRKNPGEYRTFDLGIAARAGFELGNVMIGAYFSRGLTNAYTAAYPASFHNQVFGGSLGIWLNKIKPVKALPMDADHDGTPDLQDSCPTIAGSLRWHGCPVPDADGDGLDDEHDSCISVAGSVYHHGCPVPDADQDGVNDEEDSCRLTAGSPKYHGCPIPDTDGDGVNDESDKCPSQPGPAGNQGCPVVESTMVSRAALAASNIMFHVNNMELTKNSYPALWELADSLKNNPDYDLLIEGHTDNSGSPAHNLVLSSKRAGAVKNELVRLGVPASRIAVKGYGDTAPAADNGTPEGKAKNRRVVFVFQLKNR